MADFWREEDGDASVFEDFVRANFAGDQAALDTIFNASSTCWNNLAGICTRSTASFASN